jgi:K+-transporting ATPase KdpF subunit
MSMLYAITFLLAVLLLVYLFAALLEPERFS